MDAFRGDLQKLLEGRISETKRLSKDLCESANVRHFAESQDHKLTSEETYTMVCDLKEELRAYQRHQQTLSDPEAVANRMVQTFLAHLHEGKYQLRLENIMERAQEIDNESKAFAKSLPCVN